MFGALLGGLIDKKQAVIDVLTSSLQNTSEELNGAKEKEFFYMIVPVTGSMDFEIYLYRLKDGKQSFIRKMSVEEIVG